MTSTKTPSQALIAELLEALQARWTDDGSEQSRLDFRALMLSKSYFELQELPSLGEDDAITLYALIGSRLGELHKHSLLRDEQFTGLLAELDDVFATQRPDLNEPLQVFRQINADMISVVGRPLSELSLNEEVASFPPRDLSHEGNRTQHRNLILTTIVQRLIFLGQLEPLRALQLHGEILEQITALHAIGLLSDEQLALGHTDLRAAYEREQPHLLAELYGQDAPRHA